MEVLSLAAHLLMRLRKQIHRLAPAVAAPSCAAIPAAARFSAPVRLCDTNRARRCVCHRRGWRMPRCPGLCPSHVRSQASGCTGTSAQEKQTYQPSASSADRDRLGCSFQWATPTDGNTPDLGEDQKAIVQRRPVAELLVGERVVAVAPLIAWEARLLSRLHPAKERLIGLVEPRQHILQDMASGSPHTLETRRGCPSTRLPADNVRAETLAPLLGGDALLQRRVVEAAAQAKHAPSSRSCSRRGFEFVLVRLAHGLLFHRSLFCLIGAKPASGFWLTPHAPYRAG